MFAIMDIIRIPLFIMFLVGIFVSVRFCIRKARGALTPRAAEPVAVQTAPPVHLPPQRVQVRVIPREPEQLPEPEIIDVIEALPAPSSRQLARRTVL